MSIKLSILDHMDSIVTYSRQDGLTETFYKTAEPHIRFVTEKLNISPVQAVLFSQLLNNANQTRILFSTIAKEMNCNAIRNIQFRNDFEELEKRKFIRCHRGRSEKDDSVSFRVPMSVQESLRLHDTIIPVDNSNLDINRFFYVAEELVMQIENLELIYRDFAAEIDTLVEENQQLLLCKKIKNSTLKEHEKIFLILLFIDFVNDGIDSFTIDSFKEHSGEWDGMFGIIRGDLLCRKTELLYMKYIENCVDQSMFAKKKTFRLTEKAKEEFLSEIDFELLNIPQHNQRALIHAVNITEKNLFYNEKEAEKIQRLAELLGEEHFRTVQETLAAKGMRNGFACFFYGPPGTGKTETAYQLARRTGRDIFLVDLAQIKSCWYGESEKKIKEIFSRYENLASKAKLAPILLFNEADGVFGKRVETGGRNSSLAKTENTMQNIILEEMEKFNGILIATTNLIENFDPAFERRFLYKIEFEKPDINARAAIWQSIMPDLCENESRIIAEQFDFSGGQIENVFRKRTVESIISGTEPGLDCLISICREENLNRETGRKIGFC